MVIVLYRIMSEQKHKAICLSWEVDKIEELQRYAKTHRYNVSEFMRVLYRDWKNNGSETIPNEDNSLDA